MEIFLLILTLTWIYRREIATAIKKKRKLKTGAGRFSIQLFMVIQFASMYCTSFTLPAWAISALFILPAILEGTLMATLRYLASASEPNQVEGISNHK